MWVIWTDWENALAPCHGWEEQAVHGPQDKDKEGNPKRPLWMHPLLGTVGKAQKRGTQLNWEDPNGPQL